MTSNLTRGGPGPVRVLYIAGWVRSGSTLLGNLLGHVDGCFFAGELRFLGEKAWRENRLCGCGKPVFECEVWAEIRSRVEQRFGRPGLSLLEAFPGSALRTRSLATGLLPMAARSPSPEEREALAVLAGLYQLTAEVAHASVIVDTSKSPVYADLLRRIPTIRLDIIHLVRDPRATAFSLSKRRYDPSSRVFQTRAGPVRSALMWGTWNLSAERLGNDPAGNGSYLRIRYEDFAADPLEVLRSVGKSAGLAGEPPSVSDEGRVLLRANHSVVGNPNRMVSGLTKIEIDREWAAAMPGRDRAITGLLTWPLLLRYGYPVFAGRSTLAVER